MIVLLSIHAGTGKNATQSGMDILGVWVNHSLIRFCPRFLFLNPGIAYFRNNAGQINNRESYSVSFSWESAAQLDRSHSPGKKEKQRNTLQVRARRPKNKERDISNGYDSVELRFEIRYSWLVSTARSLLFINRTTRPCYCFASR